MISSGFYDRIFALGTGAVAQDGAFRDLALEAFEYQREMCPVYREYLGQTGRLDIRPGRPEEIPFLPISLFKSCRIVSGETDCGNDSAAVFTSSATTGMVSSRHFIKDISVYERSFTEGFSRVYGDPGGYNLLALLPSYLERKGSSLVYMAEKLIENVRGSGGDGGFYLYNHDELLAKLAELSLMSGRKTILLGVAFALLDFADYIVGHSDTADAMPVEFFENLIVIETGGMKGRGVELSRHELHERLRNGLRTSHIHSEYGMAELLSQAYQTDERIKGREDVFAASPWMRVLVRDLQDPFRILTPKGSESVCGGINIIDLANINSCCFIETEDRGTLLFPDRNIARAAGECFFTVDGRIRNAELRGCNMLIEK